MAATNEELWKIEHADGEYQAQKYSRRNYHDECDDALVRMIEKNKQKILGVKSEITELIRTDAVANAAKITALCDTIKSLFDEMTSWNKGIIAVCKRQLI